MYDAKDMDHFKLDITCNRITLAPKKVIHSEIVTINFHRHFVRNAHFRLLVLNIHNFKTIELESPNGQVLSQILETF